MDTTYIDEEFRQGLIGVSVSDLNENTISSISKKFYIGISHKDIEELDDNLSIEKYIGRTDINKSQFMLIVIILLIRLYFNQYDRNCIDCGESIIKIWPRIRINFKETLTYAEIDFYRYFFGKHKDFTRKK